MRLENKMQKSIPINKEENGLIECFCGAKTKLSKGKCDICGAIF
jgi:hypothetical protein